MATNANQAYISNGVVSGGFTVTLYTPNNPAAPAQDNSRGTYGIETFEVSQEGVLIDRPAVDAGDGGFSLIKGKVSGTAAIQIATGTTYTPQIGDMFDVSDASICADSNGVAITMRCVITSSPRGASKDAYRMSNVGIRVDLHTS